MQLFYAPDIVPSDSEAVLSKEESNHCINVLRKRVSDVIHLIDGKGGLYKAEIAAADAKRTPLNIIECKERYAQLPYSLHMAVAPTKSIDRYEWFLEKATEVGVSEFTPIESYNSERRVVKDERSERVILSAVKQSIKAYIPKNNSITKFEKFVSNDFGQAQKFIAHCHPSQDKELMKVIVEPGGDVVVLIGPEGDFSQREVELAREHGFKEISLGESRLRSETAALFAVVQVAIINQK